MTEQDKKLLLVDLSARLTYGVKILYDNREEREMGMGSLHDFMVNNAIIKPYLRPMSSMAEEELEECRATCKYRQAGQSVLDCATPQTIDYLISHHFDFRGLIEKDLALEAPEGMYEK